MSDQERIPADRDDEWREDAAGPEDVVELRRKPDLRLEAADDLIEPTGDAEDSY